MATKATAKQENVGKAASGGFSISLSDLPHLQVFGLPFDSEGDIKVELTISFPKDGNGDSIPKPEPGNRGLVTIKTVPGRVEIVTRKIWGLSWDFFRKQFGAPFAKFLAAPPQGTDLTVALSGKKGRQCYRGVIAGHDCKLEAVSPPVSAEILETAWQIASLRDEKRIRCAGETEADAIAAAVAKDKYLRSMDVERDGLTFSCKEDMGHLAALLFQYRHAGDWQLPELAAKKRARPDAIEVAVETWRKTVAPAATAVSEFENIRNLLVQQTAGGKLKSKTQEFPPRYELFLPAKKKEHVWDFASVAAVGNDIYFELLPLGLDVALRDLVSVGLQKKASRPDDSFKLSTRDCENFREEIRNLIAKAYDWFGREIVAERPLPPCQAIDHDLIEPAAWLGDDECEDEPGFDTFARQATYTPLGSGAKNLTRRLEKQFGKGSWERAELDLSASLPGWAKPCELELHWYTCRTKNGKHEPWKIKRFIKPRVQETATDEWLTYAARSDFLASLEQAKRYRCTATLGRKFQAYVRIIDESGDDYWYPERFFVPAQPNKKPKRG